MPCWSTMGTDTTIYHRRNWSGRKQCPYGSRGIFLLLFFVVVAICLFVSLGSASFWRIIFYSNIFFIIIFTANVLLCFFSLASTVADPDQDKEGGSSRPWDKGGQSPKKIFSALWASVWSKNKGGHRSPRSLPWIRHCSTVKWHLCFYRLPLLYLVSMLSLTTLNLMVSFQWWSCASDVFLCLACSRLQDSMCSYHYNWCKHSPPSFPKSANHILNCWPCFYHVPTNWHPEQANICYE